MDNALINISGNRKILYSLIFLSFLISMRLWLGWEGRAIIINLVTFFISLGIILFNNIKLVFSKRNIHFFLLINIANVFSSRDYSFVFLSFLVLFLNDYDKKACLCFITKWYGYLMLPSLIVYLLFFIVDLPDFGIQKAVEKDWADDSGYGICRNYIFYMRSSFEGYAYRFNGPFLEPGHLGMISAFLLFVNHFDLKKKGMKLIFVSILFSLSLAGYLLLLFGFLFTLYYNNKIKINEVMLYSIYFIIIYICSMYYNNGDNFLNNYIFSRLEYDDQKGFSGNNRVFGLIDIYYVKMWDDTQTMLLGYPKEVMLWLAENGSRGAGFVMFMCRHGLVGLFSVAIAYGYYFLTSKCKKFSLLLFLFVCLMFWQRTYPFWIAWFLCTVYGIVEEELSIRRNKL